MNRELNFLVISDHEIELYSIRVLIHHQLQCIHSILLCIWCSLIGGELNSWWKKNRFVKNTLNFQQEV